MARPPTVWFRSEDGHFYTSLKGRQLKLSPDKKEATRLFHELLSKHEEPAGVSVSPSFKRMADLFLDESERTKKPTTYRMLRYMLQNFSDHIGPKRIADLKVHHVTSWVAEHQRPTKPGEMTQNGKNKKARVPWNDSSACSARSNILACLNWAVQQGYIASHPLTRLKRGSHARRERYLSVSEREKIRKKVKPDFGDFLLALELTGARPFSELATLTASAINWEAKKITLVEHKNAGKGRTRTIYLSPPLEKLLRRKCKEHPTGPLFRNVRSGAWESHDATRRLHYATRKLKMERVVPYDYRHTFISDALARGLSSNIIGELVGNSPVVIARFYDKLHKKPDVMIAAAMRAVA